jgi:Tfp pilus assembly protein PilZ
VLVQSALHELQHCNIEPSAIEEAMEAAAASLSSVFALTRIEAPALAAEAAAGEPSAHPLDWGPASDERRPADDGPMTPRSQLPREQRAGARTVRGDLPASVEAPRSTQPTLPPEADAQRPSFGEPRGPTRERARRRAERRELRAVPGREEAMLPRADANRREVELGLNSSSNFYKGLSGDSVVDHGGIFVQTYTLLDIGTPVALRLMLPGDVELDADAVVHWTRETRSGESEPGYGARLTRISEDGRDLVQRFVRNREPLFYDDDF